MPDHPLHRILRNVRRWLAFVRWQARLVHRGGLSPEGWPEAFRPGESDEPGSEVELAPAEPELPEDIEQLESRAEEEYAAMYAADNAATAAGHYSELKTLLSEAIDAAREAGQGEKAQHLEERLLRIKDVYRSQFTGFSFPPRRNRDLAAWAWREAQAAQREGNLPLAEARHREVLDLDDSRGEFPDIRASAGLELGLLFLRSQRAREAVECFHKVLAIPRAPEQLTQAAREALGEARG